MTDTDGATALALVPDRPTLEEALDAFGDEIVTDEQRENYVIADEGRAHWAARKLRSVRDKISRHDATAAAEIERVNVWLDSVVKPLLVDAAFFESALRFYHETKVRGDFETNDLQSVKPDDWKKYKGKSEKLIGGVTLAAKKPADTWVFDDEKFIAWADENAAELKLVRRKPAPAPEVDVNAAKAALTVTKGGVVVDANGTLVDGVTVNRQAPTFGVKVEV